MKLEKGLKWFAASYLLTLVFALGFGALNMLVKFDEFSGEMWGINFALAVLCFPSIAAVLTVLPYSIVTNRWYAFRGACAGTIGFLPLSYGLYRILGPLAGIIVGSPVAAWQQGWRARAAALMIAYCTLAILVIRRWLKKKACHPADSARTAPAPPQPAQDLDLDCPHCSQHLAVPAAMIGQAFACPTCGGVIELEKDSPDTPAHGTPSRVAEDAAVVAGAAYPVEPGELREKPG